MSGEWWAFGAGTVEIWDEGTYDLLHWADESIEITLDGRMCRSRLLGIVVLDGADHEILAASEHVDGATA